VKCFFEEVEVVEQACVALLQFYQKVFAQGIQITILLENGSRHKR
jgi:hypothetical protein